MPGGDMKSFMQAILPLLPLIIPLAGHFILVNFVLLHYWLPPAMIFSNFFFFIVGLWTLHDKESIFPIIMFIFVVALTILLDIIQLGVYFDTFHTENGGGDTAIQRTWNFSAGMMIINLIAKPLTIALAAVAIFFRSGARIPGLNIGKGGGAGGGSDSYQPVPGDK